MSAVIPVLNEAQDIRRLLEELLRQVPPTGGFEILVADGGSTDGTVGIVDELAGMHSNLRGLRNPGQRSSSGRNTGARAARGRYILFVDGHCSVPRADYLVRLVDLFEETGAQCLCRPQPLVLQPAGPWAPAIAVARHSWLGHDVGSDIYGGGPGFTDPRSAGAAYPRAVIEELGGYDERFDACEDVEFNCRVRKAGYRAYRHPDLRIDYRPRANLKALFRQMFRYGRGRAHLMARHPRVVPWPILLASALLLIMVGALAAADSLTVRAWTLAPLALWFLLLAAESMRASGTAVSALRTMGAILVIHGGLVCGFWRGVLDARLMARLGYEAGACPKSQAS